ncbi:MAG: UDP-N-acetylmuramate dehydrogenase [Ruminococcaceae bacterium]|nr:UDP-N-acetylmuramate dehydrogenase [Oscillospiraceae bacterium]
MYSRLIAALSERDDIIIEQNVPMKAYTSFQVGGPADLFLQPKSIEALIHCRVVLQKHGLPYIIMGAGSNLIIADSGIRGAVIRLGKSFSRIKREENALIAEAGVSLARLANEALSCGLGGLEFASGIPGSLGGAVYMNAGAYGGEMKDVVIKTEYIDVDGNLYSIEGDAHEFGYRRSVFMKEDGLIVRSTLLLTPKKQEDIRALMQDFNNRRREKQPLTYPSAGSFFKRPEGFFAGKLVEDAGLKGIGIGGAQVSEKHAGFLINTGGATAKDIIALMQLVQDRVKEQFGVSLVPEVRFLGDFTE